ncbi:MAG: hypothetical protein ACM3RP_01830 [Chitinophagales bacterium]
MKRHPWLTGILLALALCAFAGGRPVAATGLSFLRETPAGEESLNPADFEKLGDALQGKVQQVDIRSFGRLRFVSWPKRKRLSGLSQFTDFPAIAPPAALDGYQAPLFDRVAPIKVQFSLKVKPLNKLLTSLGSTVLLPTQLEGKTFTLTTSPELRVRYRAKDPRERADLLLSEAQDPVLTLPAGVDVVQVRAALLSLPFLPEAMRRPLNALGGQGDAPLSSPAGRAKVADLWGRVGEECEVAGEPAVFFSRRDRRGKLPPAVEEARRQMGRYEEESGDPWAGEHAPGNILLWRQRGLVLALAGEFDLPEAKAFAARMQ